jgi:hypothetical protein
MRNEDQKFNLVFLTLAIIYLIFIIFIHYTNGQDRIIHIKSITNVTGSEVKYLVFTKEGVFENSDRIFILKFNSSDLQNQLMNKKVCKVHTIGYRIPLLSEYPDITKIYWCK